MRTAILTALVLATGCGGDDGGEPIMGTVAIDYGTDHVVPDTGAAVQDERVPGTLIAFGDFGLDCGFLDSRLRDGTMLSFSLDIPIVAGAFTPSVSVTRIRPDGFSLHTGSGDVTITAVGERITGMVTFTTNDLEIGAISASGTFDVIACF